MATEVSLIDIAWAAGIFEGEGCFTTMKNTHGKQYIGLQINMTDEDVVEKFYNIFVNIGGTFNLWFPPAFQKSGRKRQWRWRISGKKAEEIFWLMAPHLGKRRRARFIELRIKVSEDNSVMGWDS